MATPPESAAGRGRRQMPKSTRVSRSSGSPAQATTPSLTESRVIADRHRRTRRDHASETAEDYVEAVAEILREKGACRVVDLKQRFAVSHVTVTRIVGRLVKEGYLTTAPYQPIDLTEKGRKLAFAARDRHEIVFRFLLAIGVPESTAAIDAEGIEHHCSSATLERFRLMTPNLTQERGTRPQRSQ